MDPFLPDGEEMGAPYDLLWRQTPLVLFLSCPRDLMWRVKLYTDYAKCVVDGNPCLHVYDLIKKMGWVTSDAEKVRRLEELLGRCSLV